MITVKTGSVSQCGEIDGESVETEANGHGHVDVDKPVDLREDPQKSFFVPAGFVSKRQSRSLQDGLHSQYGFTTAASTRIIFKR